MLVFGGGWEPAACGCCFNSACLWNGYMDAEYIWSACLHMLAQCYSLTLAHHSSLSLSSVVAHCTSTCPRIQRMWPLCQLLRQLSIFSKCTLACPAYSHHCSTGTQHTTAGGSIASCFNDLWQLDLARGIWSKPDLHGPAPTPRAGHSGALVGDYWYILGGGNNVKGEAGAGWTCA
jgi:hypothetical protein